MGLELTQFTDGFVGYDEEIVIQLLLILLTSGVHFDLIQRFSWFPVASWRKAPPRLFLNLSVCGVNRWFFFPESPIPCEYWIFSQINTFQQR